MDVSPERHFRGKINFITWKREFEHEAKAHDVLDLFTDDEEILEKPQKWDYIDDDDDKDTITIASTQNCEGTQVVNHNIAVQTNSCPIPYFLIHSYILACLVSALFPGRFPSEFAYNSLNQLTSYVRAPDHVTPANLLPNTLLP